MESYEIYCIQYWIFLVNQNINKVSLIVSNNIIRCKEFCYQFYQNILSL